MGRTEKRYYNAGKRAREKGLSKDECPRVDIKLSHSWLAGWHDTDMELGKI